MYNSSIDTLENLFSTTGESINKCKISKMSDNVSHMINGIEYTCTDGKQYGLQAYGDEAIELHKEALKYSSNGEKICL
jgi:hypothetical protein